MTQKEFMLVYRYLRSMVPELPSHMILELHRINEEIRGWTTALGQGTVDSVDWDGYAVEINSLLEDAGLDPIYTFVEVREAANN